MMESDVCLYLGEKEGERKNSKADTVNVNNLVIIAAGTVYML